MSRLASVLIVALLGAWLAPARPVAAQISPTVEECGTAAAALLGGERDPAEWEILSDCGPAGAAALGRKLAAAGKESDAYYLHILANLAGSVRAEPILDGAESLARDTTATTAARVVGLITLVGQYDVALYFPISTPWDDLISVPLADCRLLHTTDLYYVDQHPMPADYVERIQAVMRDLGEDAGGDHVVQRMASCIARHIS